MVSPPMFIVFYCHPKKKEKNRKTERHSSPTCRGGDFWLIYVKPRTNTVSLLVDRFYEEGGRTLAINAAAIASIDLPASMRSDSQKQLEDEEE
ncbi:hypothetical protein [Geobacillus stearothermophilus]|nr:hypothetical protein [Geobacillus stearothermophilus]MED3665152.1 hypothetical protein [Geobacillus stearothermophilus]MED4985311.1 hypothetical protein [Geobacillus stearothermophilus]